MWLDPQFRTVPVSTYLQLTRGVDSSNYVFCALTVPIGMRAIVTRASYAYNFFGQAFPFPTDRVFLRNGMRETSRWDYDRFTNNVVVNYPSSEGASYVTPGSYQNPDTVDLYDFGNSGDVLTYAIRSRIIDGEDVTALIVGPSSFVEVDYILVPPNTDMYTNAQES